MKKRRQRKNEMIFKAPYHNINLYRPNMTIYGMNWEFHKYDKDFNPSVPHGHSLDNKYKLRLWDGMIFDVRTGEAIGYAKSKDIKKLYYDVKFKKIVEESRAWYKENYGFCPDLIPYKDRNIEMNTVVRAEKKLPNIQYMADVPNIQFKGKSNNIVVSHNQNMVMDEKYKVRLSCCIFKRKNKRGLYGRTKPKTNYR